LKPTSEDAKRRLDTYLRRKRLNTIFLVLGIGCLIAGVFMAIDPFGPAVSNLNNVPKADPNAGMGFIQQLPLEPARKVGIALALVGGVLLLLAKLPGAEDARGGNDKNV